MPMPSFQVQPLVAAFVSRAKLHVQRQNSKGSLLTAPLSAAFIGSSAANAAPISAMPSSPKPQRRRKNTPAISAPPMMTPGALSGPPPMMAARAPVPDGPKVLVGFLVTFQNDPTGSFWPIHSGRVAMGRSAGEGIDIALQDASASSRHASIHADPATGQAFVEDDGSRNGTFLNEARLASGERRQLRDNDRLRLGSTTFVVKLLVS